MLYLLLILPMMDNACPVWRQAADNHLKRVPNVQSKCLRIIAGTAWYISNFQLREDLEDPYIAKQNFFRFIRNVCLPGENLQIQ
jgi:hypothetical protein